MQKVELIAEVAQGYEGNPKLAELLVKGAIAANADAVKIQLVYADELAVSSYPYYDLFKSLEMTDDVWRRLVGMIREAKRRIYFDVYGPRSLSMARELGADGVKISTTDFYNIGLVKSAFQSFSKVFVSIGGVPVEDIDSLLKIVDQEKSVLMYGFQAEPTETEDNNLARISTLRTRYPGVKVGFMDHSAGDSDDAFHLPLVALGQGVCCIEKHISLDYLLQVEDYISALNIDKFAKFVGIMRSIEPALGRADLVLSDKEIEYKKRAGKVAVASRNLPQGAAIGEGDIELKRVGLQSPETFFRQAAPIVGKRLKEPIQRDEPFEKGSLL